VKFIREKQIRGKTYFYFEIPIKVNNERVVLRKYLGKELPKDLPFEEFAKDIVKKINNNEMEYFQPKSILPIEQARFWYYSLHQEIAKSDLKKFRLLFSVLFILNSNRAEGSQVTRKDIEKFILRKRNPKTSLDIEVVNSFKALEFAFSGEMKWNLKSIKHIHSLLFDRIAPEIAGKFKKNEVIIGNETTTPAKDVRKELSQLLKWFKDNKKHIYPPKLALEFHHKFEAIHPFEDGNGRVGRILFNAYLIQMGYMPTIFFSQNHRSYCNAISMARDGHSLKLAHYFIGQVKKTRQAVEEYKKEGSIQGGSRQIGQWAIERGKIRLNPKF
jgi:Fic family protein